MPLFTRTAFFMFSGRLVSRSRKLRVAPASPPATRNHNALVRTREVVNFFSRVVIEHDRSDWDLQHNIFALASRLVRTFAMPAAFRLVFRIEAKMHQRVVAFAGFHDDVAALAAIATRRSAAGNKLLPPEGKTSIAAVANLHELAHRSFVEEFDAARDLREQRIVFAAANVQPRLHARSALPHDDGPARDQLSAESLKPEPLRIRVAAIS